VRFTKRISPATPSIKIMNRIRVALFNDRAAAEPMWKHLLQAGVPAEIHNEPWQARLWFVSKHSTGVRIEVPGQLSEVSGKILLAWNAQGFLSAGICCPECGSMHVDFPQFTEKIRPHQPGHWFPGRAGTGGERLLLRTLPLDVAETGRKAAIKL
jgi:hypothetical protein